MKKYRVGILTKDFVNWGGGVEFISFIINGLNKLIKDGYNLELFLLFEIDPEKNHSFFNRIFKKKYNNYETILINKVKVVNSSIIIKQYSEINKLIKKSKIDLIIPSHNPLNLEVDIPWVGYLFDFQHKYYPEFFSEDEIEARDKRFSEMLEKSKLLLVNSNSVKNDIKKFYLKEVDNIIKLPFCPIFNPAYYDIKADISNYNLPKKYFLISNQFWIHKDHVTAIKAFKLFIDNIDDKSFGLVCTGATNDYRFPNYIDQIYKLINQLNLENNVYILGYVPKEHQLRMLQDCVALIQPTLFEGGPGGFSVFESIGYGVHAIVSDIEVNLEILDETVHFFSKGDSIDLSFKMKEISESDFVKYSIDTLRNKYASSLKIYADSLAFLFK